MKTKPFSELRKKMMPQQQAESEMQANLALLLFYLRFSEVRESVGKTQSEVAEEMEVGQSALSKIEHQEDIQVSTLSRYITSLGGSLTITARFPDREIVITQFGVTDSLQH
ncbi:transcriptional regulator [Scytonema hofmannii PCC 7110]|uniref:Transcriptional regulator n=1 Tax=Scytonema hofmannii PCC 7110 TaxID=128403 RepID=A0A139X856_9CYAN|nr:helix-turn-helix transcriptional regulator [Scytonema hofmannii]KYC40812.1 transcriptional regulator [Scytonema hofmannii PCC 7110]